MDRVNRGKLIGLHPEFYVRRGFAQGAPAVQPGVN
jgi:hypothetical protein